ncbi:MAG: nucleoside phosphorylase [Candidatus Thermoplasmatota archaeon]|nr:nucleoside phosphorylase [Candidatus Thermoplasmatota archaeon]
MEYHIGLAKGEVANYILLCGAPERAERTSKLFDKVKIERRTREFLTFTGIYKKIPITVMSTGIGPDNTEIAVIEICQITKKPTFIRIGSCGALQKNIALGELVISTGAVRLENTSLFFVPEGYPAVAHYEIVNALAEAAKTFRYPYHIGLTATACGFYGAQARKVGGFPLRFPNLVKELSALKVLNFEMESSVLFTLASIRNLRAGAVCAVYAQRIKNEFINDKAKEEAELRCIKTGLKAVELLYKR